MSSANSHLNFNPLAAAAGKAPPGLSPQARVSSYNGVAMTAVMSVLTSIAFTFFIIRIYAKSFVIRRLGWDDCKSGIRIGG